MYNVDQPSVYLHSLLHVYMKYCKNCYFYLQNQDKNKTFYNTNIETIVSNDQRSTFLLDEFNPSKH